MLLTCIQQLYAKKTLVDIVKFLHEEFLYSMCGVGGIDIDTDDTKEYKWLGYEEDSDDMCGICKRIQIRISYRH